MINEQHICAGEKDREVGSQEWEREREIVLEKKKEKLEKKDRVGGIYRTQKQRKLEGVCLKTRKRDRPTDRDYLGDVMSRG